MKLDQSIIENYNKYGVVIIRKIISSQWLEQLAIGIEKNFKIQADINAYTREKEIKSFFLMIIVIGKKSKNIKISSLILM